MNFKQVIQTIQENNSFVVVTHVGPDPDAICSQMSMAYYLKSLGKKYICVSEDPIPERYCFFPGVKSIKPIHSQSHIKFDVAIILDCGDLSRIGRAKDMIAEETSVINIDHHITNDNFGNINVVDPKSSSTCEMIFDFLRYAKVSLNDDVAFNLYAGIMTDTGSFRYENTTAKTHEVVANLRTYNFLANKLYQRLYESIPLNDIKAFTKVINGVEIYCQKRVACVSLDKKSVRKFSENFDLRDTIFKFLRSIQEVEVFVILTEIKVTETRINFRSSGEIDVARLANDFSGGGHKNASGGRLNRGIDVTKRKVLNEIRKIFKKC